MDVLLFVNLFLAAFCFVAAFRAYDEFITRMDRMENAFKKLLDEFGYEDDSDDIWYHSHTPPEDKTVPNPNRHLSLIRDDDTDTLER